MVGCQIPIEVDGTTTYLFFPTADQDLSNVTLPSENGSVSTISHLDVLDDQDSITTWTYASYLDLGAYSDVAGGSSDKIVSGTSGNDSIDGTYTGDGDGDIVTMTTVTRTKKRAITTASKRVMAMTESTVVTGMTLCWVRVGMIPLS